MHQQPRATIRVPGALAGPGTERALGGLIGLDWGTSSLRAYRFDANGQVCATRQRPWGIRQLPAGGFEAALTQITEGWPALPRLACGMVGSRQGWREVAYVKLPADAATLARGVVHVRCADGGELHVVPGLRNAGIADLMRGEETQIIGALALRPELAGECDWLLPGTHSKWASVRNGVITDFRTFLTGELYALLCRHSTLGTGISHEPVDPQAFARGVLAARDSGAAGISGRLFSARALLLEGEIAGGDVSAYLSGLLIGEELRANLAAGRLRPGLPPQLIGEADLCQRYRQAAALFDLHLPEPLLDASARGLWLLACATGLIPIAAPQAPKETPSC
ncbi:2-dehydro-3-deoxygalactonokinase [Pseudomonas sp. Q1-7]|uniref:2-dehydro-3-deoxygalactonokinase n=1 Tax=Pseudomonas sp. Q1-7 TaxID=3020843 RepID=UPI002300E45A|nr:2-dehydro-3-deoxygalactonokinase [Pseudomonas sp. Q1-7]